MDLSTEGSESLHSPLMAVVVCTRNRPTDALQCVESILANGTRPFELVVVDQSDGEETEIALDGLRAPRLRYVRTSTRGLSKARNVGIEATNAPVIAFTDDDCRVDSHWVERLESIFRSDPEAGMVFGRVTLPPNSQGSEGYGASFEPHVREYRDFFPTHARDWGIGANMAIRRSIVGRIGWFDPLLGAGAKFAAGEELDYAIRALAAGFKIVNAGEATVMHLGVRRGTDASRLVRGYGVGAGAALAKHARLGTASTRGLLQGWIVHHGSEAARKLSAAEHPSGLGYFSALVYGVIQSYGWPIDHERSIFLDAEDRESPLEFDAVRPSIRAPLPSVTPMKATTVGFFPWWQDNPYQLLLKKELTEAGFEVAENPPFSLRMLLNGTDNLDVVHLHWPHGLYLQEPWQFPLVLATLWFYYLLKNNLVWTVHELDFYETRFRLPDRIIRRFLLNHCRALFVHAKSSEDELWQRFGVRGKTVLTYHPSYAGFYEDNVTREEARKRLGLPADKKVFLFFGQVKPYKGVEDLIEAFRKVEDSESILLVVGNPQNRRIKRSIEALAAPDTRIRTDLRYIPNEDVQVFFNAADIVVFPFRRTHTSGSIMLALTYGKPLIAPAIASIPEYVDESMAVLFDPDSGQGLEKALRTVQSRDLAAMGEAALKHVTRFTWKEMGQRHAEVYRLIHKPTRPDAVDRTLGVRIGKTVRRAYHAASLSMKVLSGILPGERR